METTFGSMETTFGSKGTFLYFKGTNVLPKKILNDHLLAQSGLSKKLDENSILKKLFYRENITVALEFLHSLLSFVYCNYVFYKKQNSKIGAEA